MATESTAPVGGDPSKPGAWTPRQIADWEARKACTHAAFWAMGPRPWDDTCPSCNLIIRTVNTEPDYETIAENRAIARNGFEEF